MTTTDAPLNARDVMDLLGIRHSNTLRVKIKDGSIPAPDIKISQKLRLWHRATLRKAGLLPPDPEPTAA